MCRYITLVATLALLLPLTTIDNPTYGQTAQPDEPIYAGELMTARERDRLRQQLRDAKSDQERARIRDQHRQKMMAQEWEEGLNPDQEPIYGGHLLTQQERDRFRQQMQEATSAEARERLREQHRDIVRERAKARGEKAGQEPVFGGALMTKKERKTYRKRLDKAQSYAERERIRTEHRLRMQTQAWERGLNPDYEPIYGGHLLTQQERDRFRQQMREATSAEERERVRTEHHDFIQERARQRGESLGDGPIYGGRLMNDRQRNEYRQMIRNARTAEEREQIRAAHRELMHRQVWERGIYPGSEPIYGGYMMSAQERAVLRARLRDAATDRERDRIRAAQQSRIRDRALANGMNVPEPLIFGGQMMSKRERQKYEKRLANAKTAEERQRIRERHMEQMQDRARKQLRDGTGPGPGGQQMQDRIQRGIDAGGGRRHGGRPKG